MPVGEGQTTCSMCYGDPNHGTDGYYRDWLEQREQERAAEEEAERRYQQEAGDDLPF